ncbi:sodium-coupled monocarboxylate transporter 1-like isoform X2 [Thrips palmi]|uniref:Sodium-coupled monocarboxylate transporter 1-like isoform X2 n=1 Tax=Thrips palmi TaxID=161013 RepID=A0A6P9AHS7_THRPL|nr:sodium-coupled monocarboxylate transporter 1-like isoform X2 [Thrips palmi]
MDQNGDALPTLLPGDILLGTTRFTESRVFSWLDYTVFGAMLLASSVIGVYFAFFSSRKQDTTSEYLMGGKTMGVLPVSMSLIASYISGISLLGLPAEMYTYGTQYYIIVLAEALVSFTMATVYLPVFFKLQITSSYEYLNLRFNKTVQLLGSCLFLVKMMLYMPIVIYVPALAFSQVTGIDLHVITPIVCLVCIFYTTLGGLRAVVWTDTLQTALMVLGVLAVLILGTVSVGGVGVVFRRAAATDRLELFNMDPDPTARHTFWTVVIGNYFNWLASCAVNQAMVQRCLAMPTLRRANLTVVIMVVGTSLLVSMCCYTGLLIYATFHDCDPVSARVINKSDQLLPFYVMELAGKVPGLPGVFMSGVFSAALSTMSTSLNSMTGVIWEDLVRPHLKKPVSEQRASQILKLLVVLIGGVCVGLVFLVERMGVTLVQGSKMLSGITAGTLLGVFSLGMFFPWATPKGALAGGLASFALVAWISAGTQTAMARGDLRFPGKPVSLQGCSAGVFSVNKTNLLPPGPPTHAVFPLFRLSYLWYTALGAITVMAVGMLVSYLTGFNDPRKMDRDLLAPVIWRLLPQQDKQDQQDVQDKKDAKDKQDQQDVQDKKDPQDKKDVQDKQDVDVVEDDVKSRNGAGATKETHF